MCADSEDVKDVKYKDIHIFDAWTTGINKYKT